MINDAFVMGAWGRAEKATGKIRMIADGAGLFTKASRGRGRRRRGARPRRRGAAAAPPR